jgi:antitoxin Xre/MbcA/ParS-like protein
MTSRSDHESVVPEDPTPTQITEAILWTYKPEAFGIVLRGRCPALDGHRPVDLLDDAEGRRRVYRWLLALADGTFQ